MAHAHGVELTRNLLLRAMPHATRERLAPYMKLLEVKVGDVIFEPETRNDVYFPLDGVISLLKEFEEGSTLEIGMVGPEGMAGINAALGVGSSPHLGLCQGSGTIAWMHGKTFRDLMNGDEEISKPMHCFFHATITQYAQLAACNRLHVVSERLAHWLLLLHDRVGTDEMSLTQEFLARMLGTRRAGINVAIRELTEAGAIDHRRNRVIVTDRSRLEEQSCVCYSLVVEEYERSLGFSPRVDRRERSIV